MEKETRNLIIGFVLGVLVIGLILLSLKFLNLKSESSSKSWVDEYIAKEKNNNLEDVWKCDYKNQEVYYFAYGCCDFVNPVYDKNGVEICTLGGKSSREDGRCLDFVIPTEMRSNNCTNLYSTHK